MGSAAQIAWNEDLLKRYDRPGPRYTSYPTAPQFQENFSNQQLTAALARSNRSRRPISLYIHIPFCETVCYYCACNKVITANNKRVQPYLLNLATEISQVAQNIDPDRKVHQIHWGGGTPTYLNHHQLKWLMALLRSYFNFASDSKGEFSIEVHPGMMETNTIDQLRAIGFNRLSMGVQDFDSDVQQAVNRFNSVEQVKELVDRARELCFQSISMDLIYGLPKQNVTSFSKTLDQIIDLNPDRLSLFNYAHLPQLFKTQRQINEAELPSPQEKLNMLTMSIERLTNIGYVYIGMDHFAKPGDELALAQQHGKLQRNFQGYSTHGGSDLFAFGVSAISAIDDIYVQNEKSIENYSKLIEKGGRPLARGCQLSEDDKIRRVLINQLICQFSIRFEDFNIRFNIKFSDYFASELDKLQRFADDGLISLSRGGIEVMPVGRLLIRHICMVFDTYLQHNNSTNPLPRYSRII